MQTSLTIPALPVEDGIGTFNFQRDRFTTADAALYIGASDQFLRSNNVSKRHNIPYVKVGRRVYYLKADLDAWLASNRVTFPAPV
ncbi:MAG: helix-turn-helix domain-containing protein [Herminiimonas sp.]|nr:helix-turn-helix domain-containing protein [Herminiimonas sp.]